MSIPLTADDARRGDAVTITAKILEITDRSIALNVLDADGNCLRISRHPFPPAVSFSRTQPKWPGGGMIGWADFADAGGPRAGSTDYTQALGRHFRVAATGRMYPWEEAVSWIPATKGETE